MDTAMRDLEMIQERNQDDSPGRKAAMLGMAGLSTVALVFAMGVMLGGPSQTQQAEEEDPLAALAGSMSERTPATTEEETEETETLQPGEVQFHEQLTDDRPEVEAALAAAAAEQQMLAADTDPAAVPVAAVPVVAPAAPATIVTAASAPAGDVARTPTESAIPEGTNAASVGHDGAYTLQVVSYRTREEASVFAEALRGRGHEAYVTRAEIPGRGTYFRVRIGPFDTRIAADRYRATFEREEGMNTYVVDSARVAAAGMP